ncbi:hypothetical protein PHYSODRAFT_310398 [Phytophthora sojae]|uniref:SH2 domain-containing protein n=1 Tax=Phytophthora sojae (strain P6497) TaxID=1094619 RepID=G4YLN2_PHYSP|nr:hypothetical protein PHYSODRAFT_310398 [Phytophthora sojae]EGZ30513.1 hypothetical protein PHYSODRAFT_310398 [Phytophthora sojae]|eukprot:XP_009517788.1 hypothetical protein PHYSODRAFT_310398 [Phytophthora sojae]
MIALTQRLWNCALRNGEKKLKFSDYETYMLCLHRLILPEFDIAASKELILDDWKRDSGDQDYLDYAFFHLSMFELVDVSAVDMLEESKGVTMEGIKQNLQRELNSGEFAYYRDQVKLAAEANQSLERGNNLNSTENQRQTTSQDNNRSRSRDRRRSSAKGSGGNNAGMSPLTTQNYPAEPVLVSPRRETTVQRAISPNIFTRGGGVILNIGLMDVDSTREATYSPGLQVSHSEASGSALRTGAHDPNAPGYLLIPSGANSGKPREPFTVRAAAVAEAAASMAIAAAPVNPRQTFAVQRAQNQRVSQSTADGTALSVGGGATKNIPPNFFINNSSLTAPLMTIVSSKPATPREANSSIKKIQLQFQGSSETSATRPQTPYRGFMGASISSPRTSNVITAEAAGIFLSAQQKPIKPPSSTRHTFVSSPRAGSVLTSDYQSPVSPRKMQQRQPDEKLSLLGSSPVSNVSNPATLTINGRVTAQDALQRQSSTTTGTPTQLAGSVGSPLLSVPASDVPVPTAPSQPKDDLKALISPRYIVTNPVAPNQPAPNLKQSSVRHQGSTRGFAGAKGSPRMRSSLATGPPSNHLQQQRQQRQPSELHRLNITPGKGYTLMVLLLMLQLPQFRRFLARFGPLELSLSKLVACFCVNGGMAPWFHGEIRRQEAEAVLSTRERSDGAFLVRFSESHPTKFTLTYLKVHSTSSSTPGRRELKNCLVRNLGGSGYALMEARRGGSAGNVRQRTYPSIGAFIQSSSGRLKYGVASEFSVKCNQELTAVRAMQDQQCDSYSAFSTESFGKPEPPPDAASMLFSRTPPSQTSFLNMPSFSAITSNKLGAASDSYAGFSVESLSPPVVHRAELPGDAPASNYEDKSLAPGKWTDGKAGSSPGPFTSDDYGSFASIAQHQPEEEANPTTTKQPGMGNTNSPLHDFRRTPTTTISEGYATFATLASTYAEESQQLAARSQQTVSLSRSPPISTQRPSFANTGAYGSFASVSVTKPSTVAPAGNGSPNGGHLGSSKREIPAASDYGSFASFANELEEKRPQWEQSLGAPHPPVASRCDYQNIPQDTTGIYGNFASLSLGETNAPAPAKQPAPKSAPTGATPANSDVYGSFDGTASLPPIKTTPVTSALDELNVGMEFYKQKRLDDALLRFMLAQEMARATGDQVVEARALGNLGTVYLDKKNPQQAVSCYQQCLDITRAIEDTKRERTILNNLVLALVASEDYERALACCRVQLETTTNAINRRKIISRMSLLREKMARQATP